MDVQRGRKIASLCIHVERAIGRIKNYHILHETIPITLSRLTNQIVFVCSFLSNFQLPLVPTSELCDTNTDVDEYFHQLSESNSD